MKIIFKQVAIGWDNNTIIWHAEIQRKDSSHVISAFGPFGYCIRMFFRFRKIIECYRGI